MFINTKNIAAKALTLISAAALTLSSCVQLGEEQDGAYGYLTITGFDVNVQVEQLVPTKGANLPNISKPNESDIVYKVTDKNGKVYQSNDNSWVSPLRIPVGSYTLEAWSGSNDEFGDPYFYGKTENASINIGNNTGNVTLYVANSLVAVIVAVATNTEQIFAAFAVLICEVKRMIDEKKLVKDIQKYFVNNSIHKNDLAEVIANQPKVNQWIPVSERLPEEHQTVITTHEDGTVVFHGYIKEHGFIYNWETDMELRKKRGKVVAWQPLPDPYKGE